MTVWARRECQPTDLTQPRFQAGTERKTHVAVVGTVAAPVVAGGHTAVGGPCTGSAASA